MRQGFGVGESSPSEHQERPSPPESPPGTGADEPPVQDDHGRHWAKGHDTAKNYHQAWALGNSQDREGGHNFSNEFSVMQGKGKFFGAAHSESALAHPSADPKFSSQLADSAGDHVKFALLQQLQDAFLQDGNAHGMQDWADFIAQHHE
jgi:hypothetical protein